jgi:hypothetical protein
VKKCPKCGVDKPTEEFYTQAGKIKSYCKRCDNELSRKWRTNNPDKAAAGQKKWKLANPEKVRESWYKFSYGLTLADFDTVLASQGGVCAICGTDTPGGNGGFQVDHNHVTGSNRGLLCSHCNLMLGYAKDNPTTLANAISYLEKHDGR